MKRGRWGIVLTAGIVAVVSTSLNAEIPTFLTVKIESDWEGGRIWSADYEGTPIGDSIELSFVGSNASSWYDGWWDLYGQTNPHLGGSYAVRNPAAVSQIYTVTFTLPIDAPILPTSSVGGSMGGSVTDTSGEGLGGAATVAGSSLYEGLLDGTIIALTFYDHPQSWPPGGIFDVAGDTVNIDAVNAGLPGATIPAPGVTSTIGIRHQFELAPGDSISFTSFFKVVPEPSTALLLGVGILALRRRRSW